MKVNLLEQASKLRAEINALQRPSFRVFAALVWRGRRLLLHLTTDSKAHACAVSRGDYRCKSTSDPGISSIDVVAATHLS